MERKYTFKQVAKWFVDKSNENNMQLTKSKLQKLMYYAKGFYYVFANESFFDATFVSSKTGVNVLELSKLLKESSDTLENTLSNEKLILDNSKDVINVTLDFVFFKIADLSDEKLSEIMCSEGELTFEYADGEKIPEDRIAEHFREKYLSDEQNNKFGVLREEIVEIMSFRTLRKYEKAFKVLAQWLR